MQNQFTKLQDENRTVNGIQVSARDVIIIMWEVKPWSRPSYPVGEHLGFPGGEQCPLLAAAVHQWWRHCACRPTQHCARRTCDSTTLMTSLAAASVHLLPAGYSKLLPLPPPFVVTSWLNRLLTFKDHAAFVEHSLQQLLSLNDSVLCSQFKVKTKI